LAEKKHGYEKGVKSFPAVHKVLSDKEKKRETQPGAASWARRLGI